MSKCCLCLIREAVGVFTVKQVFSFFSGSKEMETVLRGCFCARCKDEGIKRAEVSIGECALQMALARGVTHQDVWREWK